MKTTIRESKCNATVLKGHAMQVAVASYEVSCADQPQGAIHIRRETPRVVVVGIERPADLEKDLD
jgi:hypothetical protein